MCGLAQVIGGGRAVRLWWFACSAYAVRVWARLGALVSDWVLTTNHRRLAVLYFAFVAVTGLTGLVLATIIRLELAYPGKFFLAQNAERYLTVISLHGIVMVFFVVIPVLFGAFGNFLLPTQLGIRDVAFPRLNSFMFWVTPAGFVLLLHILLFDRAYSLTYWVSHSELQAHLRRRYAQVAAEVVPVRVGVAEATLAWRLAARPDAWVVGRGAVVREAGVRVGARTWGGVVGGVVGRPTALGGGSFVPTPEGVDYLNDWRTLRLEREVWRTLDLLEVARGRLYARRKFYADLYEPAAVTSKVSTWLPNHLIPGWAFVTPYSSRLRYAALGKVDVALIVVFAASLGSVFSSVNYLITYRYMGAPILKNRRELRSFFVDGLLVASRMMLLANPALLLGIILLLSDRHWGTSVFDFSGGGDAVLFQHLFWFFGHPEVYIIVIPCFGFMNSLLPHYVRKRLSGRISLQFSMYTIAFMGFAVWGHHMYMVGLANSVRTLYSTMTVMISVPASTKVIHWCVTLVQSTLVLDVGLLFLLNFMYFFVLGGLSGMFVAHIGFDTIFHDTFYVIGHFHVMLAGAVVSAIFGAFYFYFSAIFGVRYSRFFAYAHYVLYTVGQLLTLIPMFWLGYAGMPRRIMDYPSVFGGWHGVISGGHFLTVLGLVFFLAMLVDSFYEGRAPAQRMRGVSRVNTRLAFYTYEVRKLRYCTQRGLRLLRTGAPHVASTCWRAELAVATYVVGA